MKSSRSKMAPPGQQTLFEMERLEGDKELAGKPEAARRFATPGLFLGTSSFTAPSWQGPFYPRGMKSREFLSYYATQFTAVEIDSTFYGCPSAKTVSNWAARTPEHFIFSVKVPQVISHEKALVDCDAEFDEFVKTMDILGAKLGPMLFQFPSFDRWKFPSQEHFLAVLTPFLQKLPAGHEFAIEIRNKNWLDARFASVLRKHNVALALTDTSFMPRPWELKEAFDLVTADFAYVRWLGDRKGIEEQTKTWDKTIVDRRADLENWVKFLNEMVLQKKLRKILAFANNHYSGHAPATVREFRKLWSER